MKNTKTYSDIDLAFGKNPLTFDINKKLDTNAIKQSIKLLVFTEFYSVPFAPNVGSQVKSSLFENFTVSTKLVLERSITQVIENYEPRVKLNSVKVSETPNQHTIHVSINYTIISIGKTMDYDFDIERKR